jgi:peroxiredoxin
MTLTIGEPAPGFTVRDGSGEGTISLSDFAGQPVVLSFYPLAFTGG